MMAESKEHSDSASSSAAGMDDGTWHVVSEEALEQPDQDSANLHEYAASSKSQSGEDAVSESVIDAAQEQRLSPAAGEQDEDQTFASNDLWASADLQQQDIRRASSTTTSRLTAKKTTRYQKVLVVGEGGCGRTTAMMTLYASVNADNQSFKQVSRDDSLQTFKANPSAMCTELVADSADEASVVHHSIQETPDVNLPGAQDAIMAFVKGQMRQWFYTDQDPNRSTHLDDMQDPRMDVCLFFIPPSSLKAQDVAFMQELSTVVPIVPVLAKADSMTGDERQAFRAHVTDQLAVASEQCGHPVMHQFPAEELEAAGAEALQPPFAVMGSTSADLTIGPHWFVRRYQWGQAQVLSSAISDVLQLRDLLVNLSLDSLKAATERRYLTFRHEMLDPRPSRRRAATIAAESSSTRSRRPRHQDSHEPGKGSRIMAAVFLGMMLLPTMGLMFYWGKANRLQVALEAQKKDSSLREQAFKDLQLQQYSGSCPAAAPQPGLSDAFMRAFFHTKELAGTTSAAAADKTGSLWRKWQDRQQKRNLALSHALSSSKGTMQTAGVQMSRATGKAGQAFWQAIAKTAGSVKNSTVNAARSPAWNDVGARLHEAHHSTFKGLSKFVRQVEGSFHRQSHRLARRSARRLNHTRKAARVMMKKLAKWHGKMALGFNGWAASTSDKLNTQLPKRARFTRFLQRAATVYGAWFGRRMQ